MVGARPRGLAVRRWPPAESPSLLLPVWQGMLGAAGMVEGRAAAVAVVALVLPLPPSYRSAASLELS